MTRILPLAVVAVLGLGAPVSAASPDELDRLYQALGMPVLLQLMRTEGLAQAEGMESDLFGDRGGNAAWDSAIDQVYDVETMSETFRIGFDAVLEDVDIAPLLAFYATDLAQEVVSLELAGREAFLDSDVEEAAEAAYAELNDDIRRAALRLFIEQNSIVDRNVMGGLNSNLAFFEGMVDGGIALPEERILQDVWAQEPEIRENTETWIYAYLNLAYEPLSADDLDAYVEMAGTAEGRALNSALFEGFDQVFIDISRALGRASAIFGRGEDL